MGGFDFVEVEDSELIVLGLDRVDSLKTVESPSSSSDSPVRSMVSLIARGRSISLRGPGRFHERWERQLGGS